jgi:limonene 1,2-monooxygenase
MTFRPRRMKFGIFLAPFHRPDDNPTLAFDRDLELIEALDHLGYDEAWIGEHHSAGWEMIADPVSFMAVAADRTRTIRLGSGVISLPYHHPLIVADRFIQLDHMTRGRAMLGVGPGALTSDAHMMGIDAVTQRRRMDESLTAILALFEGKEPVNMETDWFTLSDARLQLAPYSDPYPTIAVANVLSPAGATSAGKHGAGILSIGASMPGGLVSLKETWGWAEKAAAEAGRTVDRGEWRLVQAMHLAESREEAFADIEAGRIHELHNYWQPVLARPVPDDPYEETAQHAVDTGSAIIGTPQDAIDAIERMIELSSGMGGVMLLAHEWANREKTLKSFELWARYVAPHFQNQLEVRQDSADWVAGNQKTIFAQRPDAQAKAFDDAGIEMPATLAEMQEIARGRGRL